jgi:imidazolonepropionase-like amidohydrolase
MAEKRIFLVPTDFPVETYLLFSPGLSPEERQRRETGIGRFTRSSRQRLERAVKAGVPIAAGSDMYYRIPGKTRGQASLMMFQAYAEAGMAPLEILRAATANAAELLGWQDRIGSLEAGKLADLIAVEGDPLEDIRELTRVKFVMKGGTVVKNELTAARSQSPR